MLARTSTSAAEAERHNPNYVGGDINAGAATLRQTIFRPTASYAPLPNTASRSLPVLLFDAPGGGVHGMCGEGAARAALRDL